MEDSTLNALDSCPGPAGFRQRLASALSRSADPVGAPGRALKILRSAATNDPSRLSATLANSADTLTTILAALCGSAPFLVTMLTRRPRWLFRLATEDFSAPRTAADLASSLVAALHGVGIDDQPDALRRFKYYELARITVREVSFDIVPEERTAETLAELSHLADVLLASALRIAAVRLRERYGPPRWRRPDEKVTTLGSVVLGMGKLGAEELNYSSDVDLVHVFGGPRAAPGESQPAAARGPGDLSPVEYFTRLAQEFGRIVGEATTEGFLYRVDLSLRPEGSRGGMVISAEALADYYEHWAEPWEKAAFVKTRPVAGDLDLGWRIVRAIDPMIYRSTMDHESVAAIKDLKDRVERTKRIAADAFDVKIGAGGIRDVETVAQTLVLLHGGRIPQVRGRSTESALISLVEVGLLPTAEASDLLRAYRFLRRTENRLQMVAERQTHRLPRAREEIERIARGMGFTEGDAVAAFENALTEHRRRTEAILDRLFYARGSDRVMALFNRQISGLLANSIMRPMIEELAAHFAREIEASASPQRAMMNLERFIQGVGNRRFYYELLIDRPELVSRLVALFATSEFLSIYFANYPRLIESIFADPEVLLLSRADLERNFATLRQDFVASGPAEDPEVELEALRVIHHREVLNVGLLDVGGKITCADAEAALTEIAETCLERALALARSQLERHAVDLPPAAERCEFLVVAMGTLASRELRYGSDLDVIFLYDMGSEDPAVALDAQVYCVRLAQKLIWALCTRTRDGICYDIDARLRPSGNQGMLVVSLDALIDYHKKNAQVWERQALLRARGVAGSARLAAAFERVRRNVLRRPLPPGAEREICRIRARREVELAHETTRHHDFKMGHGGSQDVEAIVQLLQLRHGREHDELLDVAPITEHVARLKRLGLLEEADARTLAAGWTFLRRLSSRLRIVENRAISDLDEERGNLDALALSLGYSVGQREGSARRQFLEAYRSHTSAIRAVYDRLLGHAQ